MTTNAVIFSPMYGIMKDIKSRVKSNGKVEKKLIPLLVHNYNQNMNCVDKADALMNLYQYSHRNYKWTMVK